MRISLTVEADSIDSILRIIRAGTTLSGQPCTILPGSVVAYRPLPPPVYDVKTVSDLGINAAHRERLVTVDYWRAPAGEGPQAATWKDKPHRLVYDLVGEVEFLRAKLLPETP